MTTVVFQQETRGKENPDLGGIVTVFPIGEDNRFESIEEYLRDMVSGSPESEEIPLDSFEMVEDGWYTDGYKYFKFVSVTDRTLQPVEKVTSFELQ